MPRSPRRIHSLRLLLPMLVSDRCRVADHTVGRFGSIRPEMEDNPVCLGRNGGNFLGLGFRHIENLDAARGDLDFVVMIVLVPGFQRYLRTRDGLGDKILDIREPRVRIGRFKQQTLQDFWRNPLAVVMVRAMHRAVLKFVRGHDMNVKAIGRAWLLLRCWSGWSRGVVLGKRSSHG